MPLKIIRKVSPICNLAMHEECPERWTENQVPGFPSSSCVCTCSCHHVPTHRGELAANLLKALADEEGIS